LAELAFKTLLDYLIPNIFSVEIHISNSTIHNIYIYIYIYIYLFSKVTIKLIYRSKIFTESYRGVGSNYFVQGAKPWFSNQRPAS